MIQTKLKLPTINTSATAQNSKYTSLKKVEDLKQLDNYKKNIHLLLKPPFKNLQTLITQTELWIEENLDLIENVNIYFEFNLLSERLTKSLETYFTDNFSYVPLSKQDINNINQFPKQFFSQLSEFSQIILLDIAQELDKSQRINNFYQPEEVKYLEKTGLITCNQNCHINADNLKNYLIKQLRNTSTDLEINNSNIYLNKENITQLFTETEQKSMVHLVNKQNKLVSRKELASVIWETEQYNSDYALDKFVSRLRAKLAKLGIKNTLHTIYGKGYSLQPNYKNKKQIYKNNDLTFSAFNPDPKIYNFYLETFSNPYQRAKLYKYTFRSKASIKQWVKRQQLSKWSRYFLVLLQNHPIGHIGLKNFNNIRKTASIGTLMKKEKYLKKYGIKIYKFIINRAKEYGLETINKDICQHPEITKDILKKLQFEHNFGLYWSKEIK
jgi:DNA-binding winged helix-turn-helix (wHTH) protein